MPARQLVRTLHRPPRQFFMSLRDISFWVHSARADAALAALRRQHGPEAFDRLYRDLPDPWCADNTRFRYQGLKYERLLALLPERRFARALDVGCGRGGLSRRLAPYVDHLVGVDISAAAVEQARGLSTAQPHLEYRTGNALELETAVEGPFDLVVLADVLYYLSPLSDPVLIGVREAATRLLAPGGLLLLANHCFFGLDRDSRVTRRIHEVFAAGELQVLTEAWRPFYLATVLAKDSPRSA